MNRTNLATKKKAQITNVDTYMHSNVHSKRGKNDDDVMIKFKQRKPRPIQRGWGINQIQKRLNSKKCPTAKNMFSKKDRWCSGPEEGAGVPGERMQESRGRDTGGVRLKSLDVHLG